MPRRDSSPDTRTSQRAVVRMAYQRVKWRQLRRGFDLERAHPHYTFARWGTVGRGVFRGANPGTESKNHRRGLCAIDVGQAIVPAAGFQPAGPARKRVRSQDWLPHGFSWDFAGGTPIPTGAKNQFRKRSPGAVGGAGASACQPLGSDQELAGESACPTVFHEVSRAERPSQQTACPVGQTLGQTAKFPAKCAGNWRQSRVRGRVNDGGYTQSCGVGSG
jgi:hypothetical protein